MSIPIPAGMEQAPVTWALGYTTGTEALRGARGLVRFEPTAVAVAYPDVTVLPATVTARVSAGVMDSVDLTVNDPELWNWRVVPEFGVAWPAFHIDVPVEGVDLATAVVVPGIGPIRAVTGPPGTTAWADLTGKPASFPSTIPDVDGLAARLAALEADTGWRTLPLSSGASSGVVSIKRTGRLVEMMFNYVTTTSDGHSDIALVADGFRPPSPPASWRNGTVTTATGRSRSASYYNGTMRILSADSGASYHGHLIWSTSDTFPTTLPGTPA